MNFKALLENCIVLPSVTPLFLLSRKKESSGVVAVFVLSGLLSGMYLPK